MLPSRLLKKYDSTRNPSALSAICHAPSVNLNFDQNGNVTACCFNRSYKLGTYPKNTLSEIWNGSKCTELQEAMTEGNLSKGCWLCERQLEAENFQGVHARDYDKYGIGKITKNSLMPQIFEFETSNVCNLECLMCNGYFSSSIRRNRERLEPLQNPYDDAFIEQIEPFIAHLAAAKFLGGEPFLNPLYYKIWDLIININPRIETVITTNGTILNDKTREMLYKLKPAITVSCDSLDKSTYEKIRRNASYDLMRTNLEFFIELTRSNNKGMSLAVCPMRENWKTLPEIYEFCNDRQVYMGINTVIWPQEVSFKFMPKDEIKEVLDYLRRSITVDRSQSKFWWVRENYGHFVGMLNQIKFWYENA
ncbi:MAG: radical SAM protein [Oligoflexia bacterium]|nr:radical SAM protein [Oligoflexia bacterium]